MANEFSEDLVHSMIHKQGMTSLGPVLHAAGKFSTKVELNPMAKGGTVNVPIVTQGATAQKNPAAYNIGNTKTENRPVVVDEYSVSFHITQKEANEGRGLKSLIRKNMQVIGNESQDVIYKPITSANFGPPVVDVPAANFGPDNLEPIWAAGANFPTKNLVLKGNYYSKLLPKNNESFKPGQDGAYGFDHIGLNTRWNGAQEGVSGFHGTVDSLAIATGEPAMDSVVLDGMLEYFEVPLDNDVSVWFAMWVDINSRTRWASLGLMLGSQVGDKTAGFLIGDGAAGGVDPADVQDPDEPEE